MTDLVIAVAAAAYGDGREDKDISSDECATAVANLMGKIAEMEVKLQSNKTVTIIPARRGALVQ